MPASRPGGRLICRRCGSRPFDPRAAAVRRAPVRPHAPAFMHGFKAARVCGTRLASKEAGIKGAKMYFGIRNAWSRDPVLPIGAAHPAAAH